MQDLAQQLQQQIIAVLQQDDSFAALLQFPFPTLQKTKKEFAGEFTLPLFTLAAKIVMQPQMLGQKIGTILQEKGNFLESFQIVGGFLNLSLRPIFWQNFLFALPQKWQSLPSTNQTFLVEYSSPNTNKPLHLGHLRNNFLGAAIAKILAFQGHKVIKTQIINDRGVHICKSMLAWQKWSQGETPQSSGIKGDKLVGKYYVLFDKAYKEEIKSALAQGASQEEAEKNAPLMQEVQKMLLAWEQGDERVRALWAQMNAWVYEGFQTTYEKIGITFDKNYYESQTYLLGKNMVQKGIDQGVFYQKPDGAIACDLTAEGLDEKIVQRKDGTAMYITQDLGTAAERFADFPSTTGMIYVVASEQDYHFKVLFTIFEKMGYTWAKNCHHLSYGMVELPSGKMKSREGTVVDADELLDEVCASAKAQSEALGKLGDMPIAEKEKLYHTLGLSAIKYFLLRVDPKKKMLFNPEESVQLQGDTAIFVQYTYVRILALCKGNSEITAAQESLLFNDTEKLLLRSLGELYAIIAEAAARYNPSLLVNYLYDLVATFNSFYQAVPILKEENSALRSARLRLCQAVASAIETMADLLGFQLVQRM